MCARHIYANFRKRFSGAQLKQKFWAAAKSGTTQEFEYNIGQIQEISEAAATYLIGKHPEAWCRAFFSYNSSCEAVDNNMAETFNSTIIEARGKPIIDMFEELRMYAIRRMQRKRHDMARWQDELCPKARLKLEKAKEDHCSWEVLHLGEDKFEVSSGKQRFIVSLDLNQKTGECTCRQWNLSGMPCRHSVAAILYMQDNPDMYVSKWFKVETYKKSYGFFLQPLNGEKLWSKQSGMHILPPIDKRMPGRPKKNRRKDPNEESKKSKANSTEISRKGRVMHCTRCTLPGHNAKSCKVPDAQLPQKTNMPGSKRGRYYMPGVDISGIIKSQATTSTAATKSSGRSTQERTTSAPPSRRPECAVASKKSECVAKKSPNTSAPKVSMAQAPNTSAPKVSMAQAPKVPITRSKVGNSTPNSPTTRSKSNGSTLGLKRKWV
ncbi:hypothetical protein ACHQM5_000865 [Ranunculus cassubicifolius]